MPEAIELTMTISERGKAKPTCPTGKGTKVIPQLGGFMGQTARKSRGRCREVPESGRSREAGPDVGAWKSPLDSSFRAGVHSRHSRDRTSGPSGEPECPEIGSPEIISASLTVRAPRSSGASFLFGNGTEKDAPAGRNGKRGRLLFRATSE
jgi:hypothetical protein